MSVRWISRALGSFVLAIGVASGCSCSDDTTAEALSALGEGCLLNSDCSTELVCVFRRCHVQCATTEDCSTPLRCVLGERPGHVCQLGDEVECAYDSDCPGVQRCSTDGECRDACVTAKDCVPTQACAAGVCAEPDEVMALSAKPRGAGESCSYDSDCDGELICKSGVCSWPCKAPKDCGGRACIKDQPDDEFGVCDSGGTGAGGGGGAGGGEPSLCDDHVEDGDETDVDCGGSCAGCDPGAACATAADCVQSVCLGSVCQDATCADGVRNGSEAGVDCGGNCGDCPSGQPCNGPADCDAGVCKAGVCVDASCADGLKNASETAIDCGGGACPQCDAGKSCIIGGDCVSSVCQAGACIPASCGDFVKNGAETAIDCGGGGCPACAPGLSCLSASDCASGVCSANVCQVPSCSDSVDNGGEGDIDCGGACPVKCAAGASCNVGADCQSGACAGGVCAQTFSLTIAPQGSGAGTVTSAPPGIDCGAACTAAFVAGQTVTLTAVALSGAFTGWSDPACPGLGPCTIAVDQIKNVGASFDGGPGTATLVEKSIVAGTATLPLIAEAPNGDLYFATTESGVDFGGGVLPNDGSDVGLAHFNANAQYVQSTKLGAAGAQTVAFLGIDPVTSNLVVAGKTDSNTTFGFGPLVCPPGSIVVARLSSAFAHVWSECFGAPGGQQVDLRGGRMAGGSFVLFGSFTGTAWFGPDASSAHVSTGVGDDMFVARYSLAGAHQGAATFGGNGVEDRVYAVAWNGANKLAVAATCSGTLTIGAPTSGPTSTTDACVFQLDATNLAVLGSVRRFGDLNGDVARFVGYRPSGEIVVAGEFSGLVDFMSDGVGGDTPAAGPHDVFVQGLSGADLSPSWVKTFGTPTDDAFLVFDVAPNGDIVFGGTEAGYVLDFGGGPTLPAPQFAAYLVKLVGPGAFGWDVVDTSVYQGLPPLFDLHASASSVFVSSAGSNVTFGGASSANGFVVVKLAL